MKPTQWSAWRPDLLALLGLVGLMLLVGVAAYAVPFQTRLDIGGGPDGDVYDRPYLLQGFNPSPEFNPEGSLAYRWVFGEAEMSWRGVGQAAHLLTLGTVAGPPQPAISAWRLGGSADSQPLLNVPMLPQARHYHVAIPAVSDDVALRMQTPTFRAGNDPRDLAFALDMVALESMGKGRPAYAQLGWCVLIVALAYGLLRLWALSYPLALLLAAILASGLGALLAWQRLVLTTATLRLAVLLLLSYPLTLALRMALGRVAVLFEPQAVGHVRLIAALVVVAWLVRAVALFHPQAYSSDVGLHINNLRDVARGELFFTEPLPPRAGGGEAPYPPGGYVALAPALLIVPLDLLVPAGAALLDSLVIAALWLVCLFGGLSGWAAIFAGAIYIVALPALHALSVGEMANVVGQVLTLPLVVALVLWQRRQVGVAAVLAWAAVALLGHFGVFLSLLLFGCSYGALLILRREERWPRLLGLLLVSVVVVGGLYYSAWLDLLLHRPAAPPPPGTGVGRVVGSLRTLASWDDHLGPLLTLLGLLGLGIVWRLAPRLATLQSAWWLAGLASLAPLLISGQALRWQLWLFPAVAVCSGLVLAALWVRGRFWQGASLALLTVTLGRGLWLWVQQIATYQH